MSRRWPRGLLLLMAVSSLLAAAAPLSAAPLLEELDYQMDAWVLRDAARAKLTLKNLGAGRYQAVLSGETRGLAALLSGQRRDSYQTEMVFADGKLKPLIYREETRRRGQRHLKEYRFNHAAQRLELWQLKERQGHLVLKWHTELKEPVYDPLSAFYNCRLGLLGPLKEGDTLQIAGIPYPAPETLEVRLGANTAAGRQVMVTLSNPALAGQKGLIFIIFNGDLVPTQGWTRVLGFGKISGTLLPDGKYLKNGLPEIPSGLKVPESGD